MSEQNKTDNPSEVTPGGSRIIRSVPKTAKEMMGVMDSDLTGHYRQREHVYEEFFGPCDKVSHELLPFVPHIDVFIYKPGYAQRHFYTLVSGGMSDIAMALEPHVNRSYARRESILYCDEPKEDYVELVRFFARFPFKYSTWLGHGHTFPNGNPPQPLFKGSQLNSIFFSDTIIHPDQELNQHFSIENDPVNFLWLIPITQAELDHKLAHGANALLDLLDSVNHSIILNPLRTSYL